MKKKKFLQSKQGDSIIEVLLAVAIFSAIAVTSIAIMNKGLSSAQTALESTMVRTELDAQAEAIRFIEQAYETNADGSIGRLWSTIVEKAISPDTSTADSDYNKLKTAIDGNNACLASTDLMDKYFLYNGSGLEPDQNLSTTSSSIPSVANGGLWIVAVQNKVLGAGESSKNIEYYDFYISACWDALNSPMPAKRTTIIRIHNPDYETAEPSMPEQTSQTEHLYVQFNLKNLNGSSFEANSVKWIRDGILDNMAQNDTKSARGIIKPKSEPSFASKDKSSIKIQYDYIFNTTSSEDEDTLNSSITIPEIGNYDASDSVIDWNEISTEYELGQINSPEDLPFTCNYKSDSLDTSCVWQENDNDTIEINIYLKQVALSQLEYNMNGQCAAMKPNSQEERKRGGWTTSVSSTPAKGSVCTEGTNVYVFDRWRGSDGKDYNPGANTDPIASGNTLTLTAQWDSLSTKTPVVSSSKNLKNGLLSFTLQYQCTDSKTPMFCATDDDNKRKIVPALYDGSIDKTDYETTFGSYSGFQKTGKIAALIIIKSKDTTTDGGDYIKELDKKRETQLVINTTKLESNKEYSIYLQNKGNSGVSCGGLLGGFCTSERGFISGMNMFIQSWADNSNGNHICGDNINNNTPNWCSANYTTPTDINNNDKKYDTGIRIKKVNEVKDADGKITDFDIVIY